MAEALCLFVGLEEVFLSVAGLRRHTSPWFLRRPSLGSEEAFLSLGVSEETFLVVAGSEEASLIASGSEEAQLFSVLGQLRLTSSYVNMVYFVTLCSSM